MIFDVDVEGGVTLKNHFKDQALSIFISPPSIKELKKRLIHRDSEKQNELEKRISKAKKELEYQPQFDEVIMNDFLEIACNDAYALIKKKLTCK